MTCLMRTADWMAQNDTANVVLFQCCECRMVYGACWLNFAHTKIIQCKWRFPLIYRICTACQIFRHTFLLITNQPILFNIIIFCFNLFAKSQSAKILYSVFNRQFDDNLIHDDIWTNEPLHSLWIFAFWFY